MGIKRNTTKIKGNFPVFWSRCATLPGDFKVTNVPEGSIIQKSTPIKLDFSKMECKVCRAIEVIGGTTTKPQIKKGSFVTTSDTVGEQTISAIDTSNPDYDEHQWQASLPCLAHDERHIDTGTFILEHGRYQSVLGHDADGHQAVEPRIGGFLRHILQSVPTDGGSQ